MDKVIDNYMRLIEGEKERLNREWLKLAFRMDFDTFIANAESCAQLHRLYLQVDRYIQRKLAKFPNCGFRKPC